MGDSPESKQFSRDMINAAIFRERLRRRLQKKKDDEQKTATFSTPTFDRNGMRTPHRGTPAINHDMRTPHQGVVALKPSSRASSTPIDEEETSTAPKKKASWRSWFKPEKK